MKNTDFKSQDFTNLLQSISKIAPTNDNGRKEAIQQLSKLKEIKDKVKRAYTPEEREHIDNWGYLLFTIDTLKETIKNYDIITNSNFRYSTLVNYVSGHNLTKEQAKELFNQYTFR